MKDGNKRPHLRHQWEFDNRDAPGTLQLRCRRCGRTKSARRGGGRRAHDTWGNEGIAQGGGYGGI